MLLSDVSVRRPVFATVMNLLILVFGALAFARLPLREYPDVDTPVVSVGTTYRGAAAPVVESRITKIIEDTVATIEGVESIASTSSDGRSEVTIELSPGRDVDDAANDVRDRVSRVMDRLPLEADRPQVSKVDSNTTTVLWFALSSTVMNTMELTDFAQRHLVDSFSTVEGVANVQIGGARRYAMRVWLDPARLAARQLTITDVENALRSENVELPAGRIESVDREFTVRVERAYQEPDDFRHLVLRRGAGGYLVRLGDVAEVEIGPADNRTAFRGNGVPMVGIGIVKQSTANALEVARGTKAEAKRLASTLPAGTTLDQSYDSSIFIEGAIDEVYSTLWEAVIFVALVIYLFLGSWRATVIPMVTVPVSLIGSCLALWIFGFSINLFTLLAMVLAIGLVVDDTIVVVENIARRIEDGEPPLLAAYRGTREVGFAVVATTVVLVAVFAPLSFLEGRTGKLFVEFALGLSAAVCFSGFVALTLAPVMAAWILRPGAPSPVARVFMDGVGALRRVYDRLLGGILRHGVVTVAVSAVMGLGGLSLWWILPREFTPVEDRGAFFIQAVAPEGTGLERMMHEMESIEADMLPLLASGEASRVQVRLPANFSGSARVNSAMGVVLLKPWDERTRSGQEIMNELRTRIDQRPGFRAFSFMRQGLSRGFGRPVQFVIGGPTYEELARWRDILTEKTRDYPGLIGVDFDYKETKPTLLVDIDVDRAADLGVSYHEAAYALETLFAARRVTTFERDGEEYDVMLEARPSGKDSPADLTNVYVRGKGRDGKPVLVPLAALASTRERADAGDLMRFNRQRAITLEAGVADDASLGDVLAYLEKTVREELPAGATFDYKGESREYMQASSSLVFVLLAALLIVFLVLAAQFESWVQPLVIMLTVPLAVVGALSSLWVGSSSLNIYSQIGIVMLTGLAAKNGILIVEFANQLRDRGIPFADALRRASLTRFRPIAMTSLATAVGAIPLVLASGPGAETRFTLGLVILFGVSSATLAAVIVIPAAYLLLARNTGSPGRVARVLRELEDKIMPLRDPSLSEADVEPSERARRLS